METPGNLLNPITTRGEFREAMRSVQPERQQESELPPEHPIWDVWAIMADQYGAQWTHGSMPSMGWVYALKDLSEEQLRQGVENLVHREDNKWPPNAQEFAELCRTSFTWETQCHRIYEPDRLLTRKRTVEETEIGKRMMADLKELFA